MRNNHGRRTRLLLLTESLVGGGAEKVLVTLLRQLDRSRFDITLCCVSNVGTYLDDVRGLCRFRALLPDPAPLSGWCLALYKLKYKLIYSWLPVRWVYRFFIPKGNDVEVAFLEGNPTRILSGSTNRRAKKIAWVHIDLSARPGKSALDIYKNLEEAGRCYKRFDTVAAVSASVRESFEKRFGKDVPVSVLYNPVDSDEITALSRETVSLPAKNGLRMISVGRLVEQKAFDRLIRIAGRLVRAGYGFELWILGEGPLRKQLESRIREERVEKNVILWGFRKNPYPYLAASDLFVCSSRAEGFSTAATEALLLGLPIVTTDCSGMRELFGRHNCGIIAHNDEDSLYRSILSVITDISRLDSFKSGVSARRQDFDLKETMAKIEVFFSREKTER